MHESFHEFKFRPDTTTDSGVICPYVSEEFMYNVVNTLVFIFDRIFIFAGNKENHKVSDEFEIPLDPTKNCRVSSP